MKKTGILIVLLIGVYFIGGTPKSADYSADPKLEIPSQPLALEKYIASQQEVQNLRPDNQARIKWANNQTKEKTEYALVYLHGFTASQKEGYPVNVSVANRFGMNLYLSRLAHHGIGGENPMQNFNLLDYWKSAEEALVIGTKIGKKVILMGTSTGGSLALSLAAKYPEKIHGLILLSPSVEINNSAAFILNNPWGTQIAKIIYRDNFVPANPNDSPEVLQYWTKPYRVEALPVLQQLLEDKMTEKTFTKIKTPTFIGAYYKNEKQQDKVISVEAIKRMYKQLSTEPTKKWYIPFPNAGHHVIGSYLRAEKVSEVIEEVNTFLEVVLKIEPKEK